MFLISIGRKIKASASLRFTFMIVRYVSNQIPLGRGWPLTLQLIMRSSSLRTEIVVSGKSIKWAPSSVSREYDSKRLSKDNVELQSVDPVTFEARHVYWPKSEAVMLNSVSEWAEVEVEEVRILAEGGSSLPFFIHVTSGEGSPNVRPPIKQWLDQNSETNSMVSYWRYFVSKAKVVRKKYIHRIKIVEFLTYLTIYSLINETTSWLNPFLAYHFHLLISYHVDVTIYVNTR